MNPGLFVIGDTLSDDPALCVDPLPRFEPECFAAVRNVAIAKYKRFHRGLTQFEGEGAIQVFVSANAGQRDQVLAAVGQLQFDVVAALLHAEYGVTVAIDRLPYVAARWIVGDAAGVGKIVWPCGGVLRGRLLSDPAARDPAAPDRAIGRLQRVEHALRLSPTAATARALGAGRTSTPHAWTSVPRRSCVSHVSISFRPIGGRSPSRPMTSQR